MHHYGYVSDLHLADEAIKRCTPCYVVFFVGLGDLYQHDIGRPRLIRWTVTHKL